MFVTVTINTTMDQAMIISSFTPNSVIRPHTTVYSMGGKPTDAAFILGKYGIKSLALGCAGGVIGDRIEAMLRERGVEVDFVRVGGESRMAAAIIAEDDGTETTITPDTLEIEPYHIQEVQAKFERALPGMSCVVMGGSLPKSVPPSFYKEMAIIAKRHGIPVIMDAKPDNLRQALPEGVAYIKPNRVEMSGLVGFEINTPGDAHRAGKQVLDEYGAASVISLGSDGAVAVLPDRAYHVRGIEIDVLSAVGAGDAVLAGIAYAFDQNKSIEDGLRLGVATATAVCLHPGTAMFHMEDAERFMPQVELNALG